MLPEFDFNLINESFVGIVVLAVFAGWNIRARQDKANSEHLKQMLDLTEKKLIESDQVCQSRVDIVREDMEAIQVRHDREIESIRKAHTDEVNTLKAVLNDIMKRLDDISK